MTERALPPVSVGTRPFGRPAGADGTRPATPVARPAVRPVARPAVRRNEAIISTPARAGMLLGASAAVYAVTLAGVAGLQAQTDTATAAARAPYVDQVIGIRTANDELERLVTKADAESRALAADYAAAGTLVSDYQSRLDALTALVAKVEGSAAALPTRIKLPSVTMRGAIAPASRSSGGGTSRPSTNASSGASGG
jgi:hypothetical protein